MVNEILRWPDQVVDEDFGEWSGQLCNALLVMMAWQPDKANMLDCSNLKLMMKWGFTRQSNDLPVTRCCDYVASLPQKVSVQTKLA